MALLAEIVPKHGCVIHLHTVLSWLAQLRERILDTGIWNMHRNAPHVLRVLKCLLRAAWETSLV